MADQFMEEHKIKYRDENTSKDGCIHQLAKSIGTILRRDICPKVTLHMKEAEVDEHAAIKLEGGMCMANLMPSIT